MDPNTKWIKIQNGSKSKMDQNPNVKKDWNSIIWIFARFCQLYKIIINSWQPVKNERKISKIIVELFCFMFFSDDSDLHPCNIQLGPSHYKRKICQKLLPFCRKFCTHQNATSWQYCSYFWLRRKWWLLGHFFACVKVVGPLQWCPFQKLWCFSKQVWLQWTPNRPIPPLLGSRNQQTHCWHNGNFP